MGVQDAAWIENCSHARFTAASLVRRKNDSSLRLITSFSVEQRCSCDGVLRRQRVFSRLSRSDDLWPI